MEEKKDPVLLVEDDPLLRKIMLDRLMEEGILAEHAEHGKEAIDLMENKKFSAVLLDLVMPVMSGFEVLKRLKEKNDPTPVMVFSNIDQEEDKLRAKELGAKSFYVKSSISTNDFIQKVRGILD